MKSYTKKVWSAATAVALTFTAGYAMAAGHSNPYADYEGTTLVVNFPAHPHYDAAIEVLDQFTEETKAITT